jgi:hypothetical protein
MTHRMIIFGWSLIAFTILAIAAMITFGCVVTSSHACPSGLVWGTYQVSAPEGNINGVTADGCMKP